VLLLYHTVIGVYTSGLQNINVKNTIMRILIVDDSEFARTGLKVLLAGRVDCEICGEANDGRQAVIKALALNPDVIILDYSMPDMDGLHVAQEIYKVLPTTLILICTLFPSRELEREAKKYGVRYVISKAEMSKALVSVIDGIHPENRPVS
jgi:two-component system response regulator NreC